MGARRQVATDPRGSVGGIVEAMSKPPSFLLWMDLETTGLNDVNDQVLEVAAGLASFARPFDFVHDPTTHVIGHRGPAQVGQPKIDPDVVDMHAKSGLWGACSESKLTIAYVDTLLASFLACVLHDDERAIIAGSSVHFDLRFVRRHMPLLAAKLNNHKVYDVSSHKLLAASLGRTEDNDTYLAARAKSPGEPAHRALPDLVHSINEGRATAAWLVGRDLVKEVLDKNAAERVMRINAPG